ncbi:MAG TPA: M48 family metallopeptidase [Vitreimonas sp.]|uniref:M48 family metallopeptidase n=1 Tax=Vitreimonas sp. TaxID=3069702 RepID=UPI002D22E1C7|nr:M48 family metallopeptidase [Vitreimonas sp.]HYD88524.1 M48 family metallopeptidase [Vitreimonas sp.]
MGAYGLQTHIWNNNWKTVLLMAGFPVLLLLLTYALFLLFAGFSGISVGPDPVAGYFIWAGQMLAQAWPFAIAGAILWFGIAYAFYQTIIDAATGAKKVERKQEPKLYNLLENLCISRGVTMPALRIMETDGLNAFATGVHKGQYSITVTRGLMNTLSDEELEAVLAHELTHIRNADVRLLIIAVIFVGIFSFVGELAFRSLRFGAAGGSSSRRSSSRDSGGGAIVAILVALVIIAIAYALAIVIRFALSRRREYLADAGAVELTKNPDAMISALQKISGNAHVAAPSEVREMFIENPHADFTSIFATHPPIAKRIEALAKFAGGRIAQTVAPPRAPATAKPGPWG